MEKANNKASLSSLAVLLVVILLVLLQSILFSGERCNNGGGGISIDIAPPLSIEEIRSLLLLLVGLLLFVFSKVGSGG